MITPEDIKRLLTQSVAYHPEVYKEALASLLGVIARQTEALKDLYDVAKLDGYGGEFDEGEAPTVDRAKVALTESAPYVALHKGLNL